MNEMIKGVGQDRLNEKLMDFVHELVMLKRVYGQNFITEEEMKRVRLAIMKKYGIKGR